MQGVREGVTAEALDFFGGDRFTMNANVWFDKYALQGDGNAPTEKTPQESCERWADAIGLGFEEGSYGRQALRERKLCPAGRIMYGLGNPHFRASLRNCYFIPITEDSLDGIFKFAYEMSRTYSYGGGVGSDIGTLRPAQAKVANCARVSSGAVSYLDVFSQVTGTVGQHGRRGAAMFTIPVDHPDVERFLSCKDDVRPEWIAAALAVDSGQRDKPDGFGSWIGERRRVRYANISVKVSDPFMAAVELGTGFDLIFRNESKGGTEVVSRRIQARDLWNEMTRRAHASAEPGILFWDTICRESPSNYYDEKWHVKGVNPCGEQPLEAYGYCCLGHVNLARHVIDPFTPQARIDWEGLEQTTRAAVRFLNRINEIEDEEERYPLPEMKARGLMLNRIGVGILGLADLFIRLGLIYGSPASIEVVETIARRMLDWEYSESARISYEDGPFCEYDWEKHQHVPIISRLSESVRAEIQKYGLRNVALNTVAPTGTVAVWAQTSSGIEPFFAFQYRRKVYNATSGTGEVYTAYEPVVEAWAAANGVELTDDTVLPDYFVGAYEINWKDRVALQAAVQTYIDASISSTINLPRDTPESVTRELYATAYKSGCKGITVYREGSRDEVLSRELEKKPTAKPGRVEPTPIFDRLPPVIDAKRIAFRDAEHNRVLLSIGLSDDDQMPIEVSVSHSKTEPMLDSYAKALGILTSVALQHGLTPERLARSLRGIQSGFVQRVWLHKEDVRPTLVTSVPDAIAVALQRYGTAAQTPDGWVDIEGAELCPCDKKLRSWVKESGCWVCKACAASLCEG